MAGRIQKAEVRGGALSTGEEGGKEKREWEKEKKTEE